MASTRTEIIAKFTGDGFYPECPSAVAGSLFDDAWNVCVERFRLRESTGGISLTEGVREYDLPADVVAIRQAYYEPSSDPAGWGSLEGVSIDMLAQVETGYLATGAESQPWRFYVRAEEDDDSGKRVIGLDPIPFLSSSATYPRVRIYYISRSTLDSGDAVPDFLLTDNVFLYEMAYRWAIRQDPERAGYWKAFRDEEFAYVSNYVKSSVDDVPALVFLSPFTNRLTTPI